MREPDAQSATMKIWDGKDGLIETILFFTTKDSMNRYKMLLIHEALCVRGTRVTSAVERADFSLGLNIQDTEGNRGKHPKRGILCSENGLRSDLSKVDEYLQV